MAFSALLIPLLALSAVKDFKNISQEAAEKETENSELTMRLLENLYRKLPSPHTSKGDLVAFADQIKGQVDDNGVIKPFDHPPKPDQIDAKKAYVTPITYGEIEMQVVHDLTEQTLKECNISASDGEFWDIGSGSGKVVIQQYLERDFTKAVGVEMVKRRYDIAVQALKEMELAIRSDANNTVIDFLRERFGTDQPQGFEGYWQETNMSSYCFGEPDSYGKDGRQICFINGDATELPLIGSMDEAIMVYSCSQCFPDSVLRNLTNGLFSNLPQGAAIASLKELPKNRDSTAEVVEVDAINKKIYHHSKQEQPVYIYRHGLNATNSSSVESKKTAHATKTNMHLYQVL